MLTKEKVEQTFNDYGQLVSRAQEVYNRLHTELYTKFPNVYRPVMEPELFQGDSRYTMHINRATNQELVSFGTDECDRSGDYIGYTEFKKEFLYDDDALSAYITSEIERHEEEAKRKREYDAARRKAEAEKKDADERALYERLKLKFEGK